MKRNMLATLFVSAGTPMLLAGDEMGRTQDGNNNAYCQDNEISWLDWERAGTDDARALTDFTARLIELRKRYETLRPSRFLHGDEVRDGITDSAWFDQHGQILTPEAWREPEARTLTARRALTLPDGKLELMLILLNADSAEQEFVLPTPEFEWTLLLDSTRPELPEGPFEDGHALVAAYSVMLLTAKLDR